MEDPGPVGIRVARTDDGGAIERLIARSMLTLGAHYYPEATLEASLGTVIGLDHQLLVDGTYYVAVAREGIVGAGGWSRRRRPFGPGAAGAPGDPLDPAREPANIRAFFVHPGWTRRGIGRRLLERCESEARGAGFLRVRLFATLSGVALYAAAGYREVGREVVTLPDGAPFAGVSMEKELG